MTGSQSASQATVKGVAAMLNRGVMFPIIAQAELNVDWKLTVLGLLVEALQLIAMVFNPNFSWGPTFGSYLGSVVYFFTMPLFDPNWASNTFIAANVFFWIVVVSQVALLVGVIINLNAEHQHFKKGSLAAVTVHAFASFMFLPSISILMSFMVCDTSRTSLYWYSDQSCSGMFASIYFAAGVVGLVLLSFIAFLAVGTVFDDQPNTQLIMARSHAMTSSTYMALKLAAGVSYHVLLSKGLHHVFATAFTAVCLLHSAEYAFFLPFYRLWVNRYRCAVLLVAATFAGVASANVSVLHSWHTTSNSTVVVMCVSVGMFLIGWVLPLYRISGEYRRAASDLLQGKLSRNVEPIFPLGLPSNDLAFSANKNIESMFVSHTAKATADGEEIDDDIVTITEPYITNVIVNTDVELASRFLVEHFDNSGSNPTDKMRAHGARLFSKGIARFRRDALVTFHYCQFLTIFGRKNRMAIAEIDNVSKYEPSFTLSYRAHRLQVKLKASLNMSDTTHLKLLNATLRLHKEILVHMSTFWQKLLSPNVDTVQLASIANTITTRRDQASDMFRRVLLTPNQTILLKYARFLDQVMLDTNTARIITDRVAEQAEAKRQEMLAGNQQGTREQKAESEIANEHVDLMNKIEEAAHQESSLSGAQSSTIETLSNLVHSLFFVLVLLGIGFLIYQSYFEKNAKDSVKKVEAAGRCRYLSTLGGYYTDLIYTELQRVNPSATSISSWQSALLNVTSEFYFQHSELTQGSLVTNFAPLVDFLKGARTEIFQPDTSGQSLSGTYTRALVDLFNLGFSIAAALNTIASSATPSAVSASTFHFITLNARENFALAYNRSIYYYELENESNMSVNFWVVTGLFAGAAVLIFVIYSTLVLNFQKIGASKLLTLSLFTLIPRLYLEQLHASSKEKLETFDVDDTQEAELDVRELTLGEGAQSQSNSKKSSSLAPVLRNRDKEGFDGRREQSRKVSLVEDVKARDAKKGDDEENKDDGSEFSEAEGDDENKSDANTKGMSSTLRTLLNILLLVGLLSVILALSVAAFVVVYKVQETALTIKERRDSAILLHERQYRYYDALTQLSDEARLYVQSGLIQNVVQYYEVYTGTRMEKLHQDILFDSSFTASSTSNAQTMLTMQSLADDLIRRQQIAMWLASEAFQVPQEQLYLLHRVFASRRSYNFTLLQATIANMFSTFQINAPPSPASDDSINAAMSSSMKLLTAKSLLFDDLYEAHLPLLERMRSTIFNTDLSLISDSVDTLKQYLAAALGLYAVCFFFFVALVKTYNTQITGATSLQKVSLMLGIVVVVANIVVLSLLLAKTNPLTTTFESKISFMHAKNASATSLRYQSSTSLAYTEFGARKLYHKYVFEEESGEWETSLNELLRVLLRTVDIDAADSQRLIEKTIQVREVGEKLFSLGETALLLASSGFQYDLSSDEFSFLKDFVYNRARESNYSVDVAVYGAGTDQYTNKTFDFAPVMDGAPTADDYAAQISLAQATVSSRRFQGQRSSALSQIGELFATSERHIDDELQRKEDSVLSLSTATLALSVVVLLLMVLTGMYAAFSAVSDASSDTRSGQNTNVEKEQLFDDLTDRSRAALIFVAVVLCAIYGYDIYNTRAAAEISHNLNLASTREWGIIRSMLEVRRLYSDTDYGASIASPHAASLREVLHQIQNDRDAFYLGNESTHPMSFNAINKDSAFLFGQSSYSSMIYQADCSSFRARGYATVTDLNVSLPPPSLIDDIFNDGVEPVVLQWLMLLDVIAQSPTVMDALSYHRIVTNVVEPLASKLAQASKTYHENMSESISSLGTAHYAIVGVFLGTILLLLVVVFRPIVNLLLNEEQGTKLLLRMIPANVRHNVPAIAEYLDTGSITQNEKMQKINELLTELSAVSLFVIDQDGVIIRASPAARQEFGYDEDELVGQNVKILMTEDIAKHHDEYLLRYRQTGEQHIIDRTTRLVAKRKDGSTFPMELMVREFRKSAEEISFLGFCRNITSDLEYEKITKLNEAISDMSHIPVIIIDAVGSIRRMNRAGFQSFGYTQAEIIGRNIKTLMPTKIAINHDGYLEAYQKTRKKTVVDSSRKVVALRKNGEEFPVEITVKEMLNDRGKTQFFIGYAKDISTDLMFTQNVMANEAVIQISPTPVISINPQGTILIFSPAAEKSWGYASHEVLGKNIKMLMTDEDAVRHDGYLARYVKTGEKHIVDSVRQVKAKRKDGRIFSIEANIKELKRGDHVSFIGYLKDLTQENEIMHKNRISKTVFTASPVPIVVIDDMGIVLQFNPAAEKQIGYRADQVVNQNIKILMPDHIAEQHDSYLQRYRETGVKSIIDAKRRLHAKKADGRSMAVEISVKEVTVDDLLSESGKKRLFAGYIRDITEEFQMLKANILNDAITNLCTIPMISINRFGAILTFSLAAEKQFGYTFDEVAGKNIKMLMPESIADVHDGYLKRYAETGQKHIIDTTRITTAVTAKGVEFPVQIAVKEIRKSGLDPIYVGYVRDVKTEIEVEDMRLLVDTIVDVSPVPVIVINPKGIVQKFSAEAQHVFGWKPDEIIGKNVKMLMPQEIARNHDNYLKAYQRTGVKTIIDGTRTVQAQRKDGLQLSVEILVREQKDASGNSLYVGYLRDMSQEYILRQSNELKDVILNESSIPMIQIDTKGIVMFVNPAFSEEFQYESNEIVGQNVKILTPPEIARNHDEYLASYLRTGIKHVIDSVRDVTGVRKDGSRLPITISIRELNSEGKKTYFGYIRNMTQSMQVRDQKALGDVIIDLSMIPLIIIDDVGTVLAFNRAAAETFRYDQTEIVGKNIKMLQTPEVANVHDQYLANYKKHRVKSVIDTTRRVRGRKKNGVSFPLEITVKELHDPIMQKSTYIGYLRNITDEFRLNLANEIADAVAVMSPVPLITITTKGVITKFSRAAEEAFGWSETEIVGQNIKLLQTKEIADQHDMFLERYMQTGVKRVIDTSRVVTAKKRNGDTFTAEITVREIRIEGAERTFVGFLRDLTQDLLDEASGRLNAKIMSMMMTPLVVINEQGTIEEANSALRESFGWNEQELLGNNVNILMPEDVAEKHDGYLQRYLETGVKKVLAEKRILTAKHKDGTHFPVEVHVKELLSKELNRRTYFGFLRDIRQDLALKSAFQLNDAVTDMIRSPIIAIDQVGTILKFSKAAGQVFGFDPSETIGRNVNMLMPEPTASAHDGYLSNYQITRKKTVVDSQRRVTAKKKDGSTFSIQLRVSEFSKGLAYSTFVAFLEDMTERDEQEEERRISTIVSSLSNLAIITADKRGFIQSINPATCELFNYSEQDLIGQNVKMLMQKSYAANHDTYLETYQRTKVKHIVDTTRKAQAVKHGGVVFDVEIGVREMELAGLGTRYLGFIRDISNEVILEESSKISAAIVSLSPVPIIVMDSQGTVMQFSQLTTALLGYSKDEVIGRNIKMLMSQEIAEKHDGYLARYLETRVKHVIDTVRHSTAKRKDGTLVDVEISVKEVQSKDGSMYYTGFVKPHGDMFSVYEELSQRLRQS